MRVGIESRAGLSLHGGGIGRCPYGREAQEDGRVERGGPPPDVRRSRNRREAPAVTPFGAAPSPPSPSRRRRRPRRRVIA